MEVKKMTIGQVLDTEEFRKRLRMKLRYLSDCGARAYIRVNLRGLGCGYEDAFIEAYRDCLNKTAREYSSIERGNILKIGNAAFLTAMKQLLKEDEVENTCNDRTDQSAR